MLQDGYGLDAARSIANPGKGADGGGQSESTNSQHGNMIDLVLRDSGSSRISDGGVCRAF